MVVLGRGGAGKSTFARALSAGTGLPAIELDKHFWSVSLQPMEPRAWAEAQATLTTGRRWILDGDLGPLDVLDVRLAAADTVIVLDYSLVRSAWRAARRSHERLDFWRWVWQYRRRSLPLIRDAVRSCAPEAEVHWLRTPRQARQLLAQAAGHG